MNGDHSPKPEPIFDSIFKLLAGIAFVSWMIQEWILPHNKIFLFIAIVCGLADLFYLFAHKILPQKRILIVLSWVIYLFCIWLIYRSPGDDELPTKTTESKPVKTNDSNSQPEPESILSVYPYAYPTAKQPFETDFVLENKGAYGVRDITCDFTAKKLIFPNGDKMNDFGGGGGIKVSELHAGQQTTLHSSNNHFIINQIPITYAEIEITINFTDVRWPTNKISRAFDFFTKKQENGNLIWYPIGE